MRRKKCQESQQTLGFPSEEPKLLRAIHANANDAARAVGLEIIRNFRVPRKSAIYRVFEKGLLGAEATENLA